MQESEVAEVEETVEAEADAVEETVAETPNAEKPAEKSGKKPAEKPAKTTVSEGGDTPEEPAQKESPYWPDDWREKLAEHMSAGDKKSYDKELRRLKNVADPTGIYGIYRDLEQKFSQGGLIKVPGKDAKEEDIKAYRDAIGMPEDVNGLIENIQLEDGAVLGEMDKPVAERLLGAFHSGTTPQEQASNMVNEYYKMQEEQAAALDEKDEAFKREASTALKEEYGAAFKRKVNTIASVFKTAPGGADVQNPESLMHRLLGGRMADGTLVGDDPDFVRLMVHLAGEVDPAMTVVDDMVASGVGIDEEIAELKKKMRDRVAWSKDEKSQARYRELIEAQNKIQARKSAA